VTSEREQFDELWRTHAGSIFAYAARRVGRDAAEEVVADVFGVAWRRMDQLPNEPLPWLYGVAHNVIRQRHRSESRRQRLHETLVTTLVTSTGLDDVSAITEALKHLDERDQEVLRLVAWEELEPRQAAQVLGVTAAAFRMRLSRARGRLRTELERSRVVDHED
jgi:RNA polymerase sigma-70 factor (ECF subfamily)